MFLSISLGLDKILMLPNKDIAILTMIIQTVRKKDTKNEKF